MEWKRARVGADHVFHMPEYSVPPSELACPRIREWTNVTRTLSDLRTRAGALDSSERINKYRGAVQVFQEQVADQMVDLFDVEIDETTLAGVNVEVIRPRTRSGGSRALLNLHAVGLVVGRKFGSRIESITCAAFCQSSRASAGVLSALCALPNPM